MPTLTFKEDQYFLNPWIRGAFSLATLFPLYAIVQQIILGNPMGGSPMSDSTLLAFAGIVIGMVFLAVRMRLSTVADEKTLTVRYYPFVKRTIAWSDVKHANVLNYGFAGGWGIRVNTQYGTVFNIKGGMGVAIVPKNGEQFLVGTQKPDEWRAFLEIVNG